MPQTELVNARSQQCTLGGGLDNSHAIGVVQGRVHVQRSGRKNTRQVGRSKKPLLNNRAWHGRSQSRLHPVCIQACAPAILHRHCEWPDFGIQGADWYA